MLLRADLRKRQTKHKEQHRLKKQTNKYSYKGDEGGFFSLSLFFSVATSERRHSHLRYCNDRVTTLCWSTARWRRLLAASRRFPFFLARVSSANAATCSANISVPARGLKERDDCASNSPRTVMVRVIVC